MNELIKEILKLDKNKLRIYCKNYKYIFKGYSKIDNKRLREFIVEKLTRRSVISGGYGDSLEYDKISLFELNMGIKVEYEHTTDYWKSVDIAFDHLFEIPDYYTRLNKLEKHGEKYWQGKNKKEFAKKENLKQLNKIK